VNQLPLAIDGTTMGTRFVDFWKAASGSKAVDINFNTAFREMFDHSLLHFWQPGDPVANREIRILVSVATFAFNDMFLLDWIEAFLSEHSAVPVVIDVAHRDDCYSLDSNWSDHFPNQPQRLITPVVGLWSDGKLVEISIGTNTLFFMRGVLEPLTKARQFG
jgi:hypothetical protein